MLEIKLRVSYIQGKCSITELGSHVFSVNSLRNYFWRHRQYPQSTNLYPAVYAHILFFIFFCSVISVGKDIRKGIEWHQGNKKPKILTLEKWISKVQVYWLYSKTRPGPVDNSYQERLIHQLCTMSGPGTTWDAGNTLMNKIDTALALTRQS